MFRKLAAVSFSVAVVVGAAFSGSFASAAEVTVNPGESIQDAITSANAGDVITVAAGTYTGPINVTKAVTLKGAQAGADARSRSGAETVVMSANSNGGFNVQSEGVTIDGFTIDGSSPVAPATYARGVLLSSSDVSGLTIINNVFRQNQTAVSTSSAVVPDVSGLRISQNVFTDNFSLAAAPSGGTFMSNTAGSDVMITDNAYSGTNGSSGSSNAIVVSGQPGAPLEQVVISGNTSSDDGSFVYVYNASQVQITNNQSSDQAGNGVLIGDNTSSVSVADNVFSNSNNGIRFGGSGPAANVTISSNTITGMQTAGVIVSEGVVIEDVVVVDNTITGNSSGVVNGTLTPISANNNWWGCEAGPGAVGCDTIDGIVLASSWYTDDAMSVTNLDAANADDTGAGGNDDPVPGVPNTGWASNYTALVVAMLATVAAVIASMVVVYRRRSIRS